MSVVLYPIVKCEPGPVQQTMIKAISDILGRPTIAQGQYIVLLKIGRGDAFIAPVSKENLARYPITDIVGWGGCHLVMVNSPTHMIACVERLKRMGKI
jgi:hypothetical protein